MQTITTHAHELPLVLKASDIQRLLDLSCGKTYELLHQKGFPVMRIGPCLHVPGCVFAVVRGWKRLTYSLKNGMSRAYSSSAHGSTWHVIGKLLRAFGMTKSFASCRTRPRSFSCCC
jgi:hypothetical protein